MLQTGVLHMYLTVTVQNYSDIQFNFRRDTLYAARMARDILWEKEESIDLDEFVRILQTFVIVPYGGFLRLKLNAISSGLSTCFPRQMLHQISIMSDARFSNTTLYCNPPISQTRSCMLCHCLEISIPRPPLHFLAAY